MGKTHRRKQRASRRPRDRGLPAELHASEVLTVAWTVSVTGVLIADLMFAAAHLYVRTNPAAVAARALEGLLLLSAAGMGAVSLALLVAVWRTRRLKPPRGYLAFAVIVAVAPLVVMLGRLVM